ncbi:GPI-linked NAD(P)(+)--arginine ADP-ribosyltransferase 1-like [Camarhynchus parvulus]|uniref:GPI-linked NAD(P)(+)--arginine ADP-ribosyltransferase 1-like n=1 Tax=Geospiza parvula TaxID=87175 RepID=UPI0012383701|nr:GPI-linked NAD(P)(+)--arginine ADP-ribosyltransferase 1-like [Camarhynchus parvulus]
MALLAQTLALLAMTVTTAAIKVVPLDMARDSFDEQYQGCTPAMITALPGLNHFEFQVNPLFTQTRVKAEAAWHKRGILENFHFKTLHFLLTQALVTLRHAQNGQCHHVFRGVHDVRFQARCGQKVRFGQFTFY